MPNDKATFMNDKESMVSEIFRALTAINMLIILSLVFFGWLLLDIKLALIAEGLILLNCMVIPLAKYGTYKPRREE